MASVDSDSLASGGRGGEEQVLSYSLYGATVDVKVVPVGEEGQSVGGSQSKQQQQQAALSTDGYGSSSNATPSAVPPSGYERAAAVADGSRDDDDGDDVQPTSLPNRSLQGRRRTKKAQRKKKQQQKQKQQKQAGIDAGDTSVPSYLTTQSVLTTLPDEGSIMVQSAAAFWELEAKYQEVQAELREGEGGGRGGEGGETEGEEEEQGGEDVDGKARTVAAGESILLSSPRGDSVPSWAEFQASERQRAAAAAVAGGEEAAEARHKRSSSRSSSTRGGRKSSTTGRGASRSSTRGGRTGGGGGGKWVSPMVATRSRSRLPYTVKEGDHRKRFKYKLANDEERDVFDTETPGPGAYGALPLAPPRGGRFSTANPKSDVEWQIYTKSLIPGPADYYPQLPRGPGGKFNKSKPKSTLEWVIYHAKDAPAPTDYKPAPLPAAPGGTFSTAFPKTELEWTILRASKVPGAGTYKPSDRTVSKYRRAPAAILQGKVVKGNHQTTLADATSFIHSTVNPQGPNSCRTDSAIGRQVTSTQRSAPAYSFSSSAERDARGRKWTGAPPKGRSKQRKKKRRNKRSKSKKKKVDGQSAGVEEADGDDAVLGLLSSAGVSTISSASGLKDTQHQGADYYFKYYGYSPVHDGAHSFRGPRPVLRSSPNRTQLLRRSASAGGGPRRSAAAAAAASSPSISYLLPPPRSPLGLSQSLTQQSAALAADTGTDERSALRSVLSRNAFSSAAYADIDDEVVKVHTRPKPDLIDHTLPGPGTTDPQRNNGAVGKQASSKFKSAPSYGFGTSTRRDQLKLTAPPEARIV